MIKLPELRLAQPSINAEFSEHLETWYGWEWPIANYYVFEQASTTARLGTATICCDVVMPDVLIGDQGHEIGEALASHARQIFLSGRMPA